MKTVGYSLFDNHPSPAALRDLALAQDLVAADDNSKPGCEETVLLPQGGATHYWCTRPAKRHKVHVAEGHRVVIAVWRGRD